MRYDVMTLFPEAVNAMLGFSIIARAESKGVIGVHTHDIRDYSTDRRRRVDDTPYGGGKGMLIGAQPVCDCFDAVCAIEPELNRRVIYMSPQGSVLSQKTARRLSGYDRLIILCGHYEGIDERAVSEIVDEEISVGDYVLTGGELPACILIDCVSRLIKGVLADDECFENESHSEGLLEYAQYTRPEVFRGKPVPQVLLGGNHAEIDRFRYLDSLNRTTLKRPDLL